MSLETYTFSKKIGLILKKNKLTIATAESCTGGLLAAAITATPGSSSYFTQGYIVYSNQAKKEVLGVKNVTLKKYGAISKQVAKEMAKGVTKLSNVQISIGVTGIAGPTGATKNKPIGTVCFSWITPKLVIKTTTKHFKGNRNSIRMQSVNFALKILLNILKSRNK